MAKSDVFVNASCVGGGISMFLSRATRRGLTLAVVLFLVPAMVGCRPEAKEEAQGAPLQMTIALLPTTSSALIAVADDQGFFKKAGIEVTTKRYSSGLEALRSVMAGEAHVATVADVAFALAMEEDPSLRVIASIGTSVGSEIVARKDRGIREPADLAGKRIGHSPGTSSTYFLRSFLLTHHIGEKEVTLVAVPPGRQVAAVVSGEVDAVSAFDLFAYPAKKELGTNAVSWNSQNTLDYQWLLVTKEGGGQSPEALQRLLGGLIMAEEFAVNHDDDTKSILARKWHLEPDLVHNSWKDIRLFVSFNQSIITALESYAKWKGEAEGRTNSPPDVRAYIETGPLEELNPKLVTIFK